jgi:hypothetical protein
MSAPLNATSPISTYSTVRPSTVLSAAASSVLLNRDKKKSKHASKREDTRQRRRAGEGVATVVMCL